jgi:hypothetical protein
MAKIDVTRGWFETVICSARRGQDARLRRALEARSAYKRRQTGWRLVSDSMEEHFGSQDAFEHLLSGPPLVGAFEGPNVRLEDVGNDA